MVLGLSARLKISHPASLGSQPHNRFSAKSDNAGGLSNVPPFLPLSQGLTLPQASPGDRGCPPGLLREPCQAVPLNTSPSHSSCCPHPGPAATMLPYLARVPPRQGLPSADPAAPGCHQPFSLSHSPPLISPFFSSPTLQPHVFPD